MRRLVDVVRARPLSTAIVVGALLRMVAALVGYGFFASDDYTHVIGMAYTWLDDPSAPFNSPIRSPLLARIVWLCFELAHGMGWSDPAALVRTAYVVLGLFDVLAIPGVYALAEERLGRRAALTAAWLMAAEAVMPRIATRALISVVAMVPLVWGTVFVSRGRRLRDGFVGGLLVGVAALFRYQVGLVCLVLAGLMALRARRDKAWRPFVGLVLGGLVAAVAQGLVDRVTQGAWFGSIIGYVTFNESGASRYGVAPWFTYVLDFAGLSLPPATIWLAKPFWRFAKAHVFVSVPFVVFVVAHSLVPHKEEHFIFAVLPYFFVSLGGALAEAWTGGVWARRACVWFWGVNAVALALVTVSDGHRSLTRPLLQTGRECLVEGGNGIGRVYFVGKLLTPDFYLGRTVELRRVRDVGELVSAMAGETVLRLRVIFERVPDDEALRSLERTGFACGAPVVSRGDLVDRVLVFVNPVNRRRGEKSVVDCWR